MVKRILISLIFIITFSNVCFAENYGWFKLGEDWYYKVSSADKAGEGSSKLLDDNGTLYLAGGGDEDGYIWIIKDKINGYQRGYIFEDNGKLVTTGSVKGFPINSSGEICRKGTDIAQDFSVGSSVSNSSQQKAIERGGIVSILNRLKRDFPDYDQDHKTTVKPSVGAPFEARKDCAGFAGAFITAYGRERKNDPSFLCLKADGSSYTTYNLCTEDIPGTIKSVRREEQIVPGTVLAYNYPNYDSTGRTLNDRLKYIGHAIVYAGNGTFYHWSQPGVDPKDACIFTADMKIDLTVKRITLQNYSKNCNIGSNSTSYTTFLIPD